MVQVTDIAPKGEWQYFIKMGFETEDKVKRLEKKIQNIEETLSSTLKVLECLVKKSEEMA